MNFKNQKELFMYFRSLYEFRGDPRRFTRRNRHDRDDSYSHASPTLGAVGYKQRKVFPDLLITQNKKKLFLEEIVGRCQYEDSRGLVQSLNKPLIR